ncbi:CDGSH iron-sulfur domain-containing protein 3, mitochondrial-like isoform X3 [Xiphias gladius]|uniref:CDGSH iron-sulfur domain-containing protein 3, mitochondrial-like isoform X3 n=1 Tax=Xiphias gladius TaxID=8245 RepID=UPI001A97E662|nr:CDGSH iron-sulfur domain-containing protein 3, mitochondrial-like isoform X3 [Xiphias gladius]
MNTTIRVVAVRGGCAQSFRRPQLEFPVSSPAVRRCQMSRQPVPAARLPYRVKLSAGKRYAWCACGHSKKQPFCDGAHRTEAPSISPLRQRHDGHAVCL